MSEKGLRERVEWKGPWVCATCAQEFEPATFAEGVTPSHVIENPDGPGFVTCGTLRPYDRRHPEPSRECTCGSGPAGGHARTCSLYAEPSREELSRPLSDTEQMAAHLGWIEGYVTKAVADGEGGGYAHEQAMKAAEIRFSSLHPASDAGRDPKDSPDHSEVLVYSEENGHGIYDLAFRSEDTWTASWSARTLTAVKLWWPLPSVSAALARHEGGGKG